MLRIHIHNIIPINPAIVTFTLKYLIIFCPFNTLIKFINNIKANNINKTKSIGISNIIASLIYVTDIIV